MNPHICNSLMKPGRLLGRFHHDHRILNNRCISTVHPLMSLAPNGNLSSSKPSSRSMVTLSSKQFAFQRPDVPLQQLKDPKNTIHRRYFHSEGAYHNVADDTLETIQDTVDEVLEDAGITAEVNFSSGVLTIALPDGNTYVLNKQTPNQQIWWSSPVSGPRRYEYNDETQKWVFTRDATIGLGTSLTAEFHELLNVDLELDV